MINVKAALKTAGVVMVPVAILVLGIVAANGPRGSWERIVALVIFLIPTGAFILWMGYRSIVDLYKEFSGQSDHGE